MLRLNIMLTIFVPLMIALLITVFIPTSIMLLANPKQQSIYRSLKLRNQQIFVRNLLSQDKRIIEKRLQIYENIRNTLVPTFMNAQNYQTYNTTALAIQPAYGVTASSNVSMWWAGGTTQPTLTTEQQAMLDQYMRVQAYSRALLSYTENVVVKAVWTFTDGIQVIFPSVPSNLSGSVFSEDHNTTVTNWQQYSYEYSQFSSADSLQRVCNVLSTSQDPSEPILGTLCFVYNGSYFFNQAFKQSIIPQTNYLQGVYMFLMTTPNQKTPYLMFSYSPNDTSSLRFFTNRPIFDNTSSQARVAALSPYWMPNTTDEMQIVFSGTLAVYQTPIMIYDYHLSKIAFSTYMITSDQVQQNIHSNFSAEHLVPILLTPGILFLVSCFLSYILLNRVVSSLASEISTLLKKSGLLMKGDLEVEIPQFQGTRELRNVYDQLRTLADLAKYSDENYFKGNNSQKSIKYYKALAFFGKLERPKSVALIQENLAGLCCEQGEFEKAVGHYKLSIAQIDKDMLNSFKKLKTIRNLYEYIRARNKKLPSQLKPLQRILIRRYFNYLEALSECAESTARVEQKQNCLETLLLILQETPTDPRYILLMLRLAELSIRKGQFQEAGKQLDSAEQLCRHYHQQISKKTQVNYPPEVLYQQVLYLRGLCCQLPQQSYQAFSFFRQAFDGDRYDPRLRLKLQQSLKKLLVPQNLLTKQLRQSVYFAVEQNQFKEYIFVVDFSSSMKSVMEVKKVEDTRKNFVVNQLLRIYDEDVRDGDRVSLVKFSDEMQVVFNLTEKGRYGDILRQSIQELKADEPDGRTALYSTLKIVMATIKHLKRHKVLVLAVDGPDNCSRVTLRQIQQLLAEVRNLTVLVLCVELDDYSIEGYHDMLAYHSQGYVVDFTDTDYINRILRAKVYKKQYVETYVCC